MANMSDSASTDSFETFKSDELIEGTIKSLSASVISSPGDDEYRTAREMVTSSINDNYYSAESPDPSESTLRDLHTLNYLQEALDNTLVTSTTMDDIRDSSWQDLDRDLVSAWVGPHNVQNNEKKELIIHYLKRNDNHSSKELKKLGQQEDGFLSDELRRLVWPKVTKRDIVGTSARPDKAAMESHEFYQQVMMDVNRSLKRFPPSIKEAQRMSMQDQLVRLIMRILIKNPQLHYYQGYHDVCVTFLLILGEEKAFHIVDKLSQTHLKVFMEQTMENTSNLLELIPLLIDKESPSLGMFLRQSGVGTIFSLSWVITWFSHVLKSYDSVGRLFDLFLVSHRYMPIYLTVAVLLYKEDEILRLDCDMASVHQYLTRLFENEEDNLPIERLILNAKTLMVEHCPQKMAVVLDALALERRQAEATRRRKAAIQKLFSVRGIFQLASTRYGMASMSLFVVVAASLVQMYWTRSK
ncbi:TBC1 domain family member 20 [Halotydeus destructor]|nr:TBC1 domain family member 20 [Halotydeus destructor]